MGSKHSLSLPSYCLTLNARQQIGIFGEGNRILWLLHWKDIAFLLANRLATNPTATAGQGGG